MADKGEGQVGEAGTDRPLADPLDATAVPVPVPVPAICMYGCAGHAMHCGFACVFRRFSRAKGEGGSEWSVDSGFGGVVVDGVVSGRRPIGEHGMVLVG